MSSEDTGAGQNMILLAFTICLLNTVVGDVVIETSTGPVQGTTVPAGDVEAFLGIPYAEPPIGDLRFAKPNPIAPWTETFKASELPPPCAQITLDFPYYFMPDVSKMTEDCLFLNIWVPKSNTSKPVIVYIHPGAFFSGSSSLKQHDGENFARGGDLMVVTINYRLGAFGFLSAEGVGNMGMYDQNLAMRWVKENAIHFGGDPDNIVLMGVSAGAFSVAAHLVSPLSKNLFHKAIIESGSIVHPFFFHNARVYRNSQQIASATSCSNKTITLRTDPQAVIRCLKEKPVEDIVKAEKALQKSNPFIVYPILGNEFLPKSGRDLLKEKAFDKDIPVLMGVNKDEGSLLLIITNPDYFGHFGHDISLTINERRANAIMRGLMMLVNETKPTDLVRFYTNLLRGNSTEAYIKMLSDAAGDYLLSCSTLFLAEFLSLNQNPVYFYKLAFRSVSTPMAEWTGTLHLDEVQYIFGNPYHGNFTAQERDLAYRMMERWSEFARSGNPNLPGRIPWLPYTYENPLYLSFEQEEESIRIHPNKRCDIWRKRFQAAPKGSSLEKKSSEAEKRQR